MIHTCVLTWTSSFVLALFKRLKLFFSSFHSGISQQEDLNCVWRSSGVDFLYTQSDSGIWDCKISLWIGGTASRTPAFCCPAQILWKHWQEFQIPEQSKEASVLRLTGSGSMLQVKHNYDTFIAYPYAFQSPLHACLSEQQTNEMHPLASGLSNPPSCMLMRNCRRQLKSVL